MIYATTFVYTQIKQITHYSHHKACIQQSVQRLFAVHDECIVQKGFQGNRHHFIHEQIEKVAVYRGRTASNAKFRYLVWRHGIHCLSTFDHLVRTVQAQHIANHLMKMPVIMVVQGALVSFLRNSCQNA